MKKAILITMLAGLFACNNSKKEPAPATENNSANDQPEGFFPE